jgi:hypothetical protein
MVDTGQRRIMRATDERRLRVRPICHSVSSRPSPSVACHRVCPRLATELARKTREPGRSGRVATHDSWLSEAERGGFEPPVPLARHAQADTFIHTHGLYTHR